MPKVALRSLHPAAVIYLKHCGAPFEAVAGACEITTPFDSLCPWGRALIGCERVVFFSASENWKCHTKRLALVSVLCAPLCRDRVIFLNESGVEVHNEWFAFRFPTAKRQFYLSLFLDYYKLELDTKAASYVETQNHALTRALNTANGNQRETIGDLWNELDVCLQRFTDPDDRFCDREVACILGLLLGQRLKSLLQADLVPGTLAVFKLPRHNGHWLWNLGLMARELLHRRELVGLLGEMPFVANNLRSGKHYEVPFPFVKWLSWCPYDGVARYSLGVQWSEICDEHCPLGELSLVVRGNMGDFSYVESARNDLMMDDDDWQHLEVKVVAINDEAVTEEEFNVLHSGTELRTDEPVRRFISLKKNDGSEPEGIVKTQDVLGENPQSQSDPERITNSTCASSSQNSFTGASAEFGRDETSVSVSSNSSGHITLEKSENATETSTSNGVKQRSSVAISYPSEDDQAPIPAAFAGLAGVERKAPQSVGFPRTRAEALGYGVPGGAGPEIKNSGRLNMSARMTANSASLRGKIGSALSGRNVERRDERSGRNLVQPEEQDLYAPLEVAIAEEMLRHLRCRHLMRFCATSYHHFERNSSQLAVVWRCPQCLALSASTVRWGQLRGWSWDALVSDMLEGVQELAFAFCPACHSILQSDDLVATLGAYYQLSAQRDYRVWRYRTKSGCWEDSWEYVHCEASTGFNIRVDGLGQGRPSDDMLVGNSDGFTSALAEVRLRCMEAMEVVHDQEATGSAWNSIVREEIWQPLSDWARLHSVEESKQRSSQWLDIPHCLRYLPSCLPPSALSVDIVSLKGLVGQYLSEKGNLDVDDRSLLYCQGQLGNFSAGYWLIYCSEDAWGAVDLRRYVSLGVSRALPLREVAVCIADELLQRVLRTETILHILCCDGAKIEWQDIQKGILKIKVLPKDIPSKQSGGSGRLDKPGKHSGRNSADKSAGSHVVNKPVEECSSVLYQEKQILCSDLMLGDDSPEQRSRWILERPNVRCGRCACGARACISIAAMPKSNLLQFDAQLIEHSCYSKLSEDSDGLLGCYVWRCPHHVTPMHWQDWQDLGLSVKDVQSRCEVNTERFCGRYFAYRTNDSKGSKLSFIGGPEAGILPFMPPWLSAVLQVSGISLPKNGLIYSLSANLLAIVDGARKDIAWDTMIEEFWYNCPAWEPVYERWNIVHRPQLPLAAPQGSVVVI